MKQFIMNINLLSFKTFDEYAKTEDINKDIFIFTTKPVYDAFIEKQNFPCKTIFIENYGKGEPTTDMVDNIRADMPANTKTILAIGGGSVMDIAKILSLDVSGNTEDLFLGKAKFSKARETITIPTTCGTGSEVTTAVATEIISLKTKRGLSLSEFAPDKAVLIPELLLGLPYHFFATSSIDALVHAVESFLSPKASPQSELFSVKAIEMLLTAYKKLAKGNPDSWKEDAADYLIASNYAGIAFSNAGCAAVHALSYPLGGKYHIAHGEANQLMMPEVLRKYKDKQPVGRLNDLENLLSGILDVSPADAVEEMITLADNVLARKPLSEYGIQKDEFPSFADGVIEGQQRLLSNNYVELSKADIIAIYEASF